MNRSRGSRVILQWTINANNSTIVGVIHLRSTHVMKRLLASPDSAQIGLLRSRLEAAGISCELRNEHLSPAMPGAPFYPELWVLDDAQFSEASKLIAAWQQPAPPTD